VAGKTPLEAAKTFMAALAEKDPEKAAALCADEVVIELPGGDNELKGRDGARQLMRMAPPFQRIVRDEKVIGDTVVLTGLTRAPGQFTNYTTWTFETDQGLLTRITFSWRPAN
jgi:ketosteroid isomerase-like protein